MAAARSDHRDQISPSRRWLFRLTAVLLAATLVEASAQAIFRLRSPQHLWIGEAAVVQPLLFRHHPFLSISGVPGVRSRFGATEVSHNSLGYRGRDPGARKPAGVRRIVALGGSSTYGVFVSDGDTWPAKLEARLGSPFEVVNLGVPGYTTAEHVIQSAFEFSELSPDIAIYYVGWNDLRNVHVANLDPYYAAFHGASQPDNLRVDDPPMGRSASLFYLRKAWAAMRARSRRPPAIADADALTVRPDPRALGLFARNLRTLIDLCRAQGVRPVLVPHAFNCPALTSDRPYGWLPYVRDRDVCTLSAGFDDVMQKIGREANVLVVSSVLDRGAFDRSDFYDEGHFTSSGSIKFAEKLAKAIASAP